jgi:hypothetical protein
MATRSMSLTSNYLLGYLVICDVYASGDGPFNVQIVLVQLQEENDKDKEGINHEKAKHGRVSQFFQVFRDTCLG